MSGNVNGRPRAGLAAAEKVRELVDPAEWIAFELETARDTKMAHERRSAAWHALIDRGFIKPPAGLDLAVSQGSEPQRDLSKLTTEQLTEMLETLRGLPAIDDGSVATERTHEDSTTEKASDVALVATTPTVP